MYHICWQTDMTGHNNESRRLDPLVLCAYWTYTALFAVQSPAWGIQFFALLVLTFLLQVVTGETKTLFPIHNSDSVTQKLPENANVHLIQDTNLIRKLTTVFCMLRRCFLPKNQSTWWPFCGNPPPETNRCFIKKKEIQLNKSKDCWFQAQAQNYEW